MSNFERGHQKQGLLWKNYTLSLLTVQNFYCSPQFVLFHYLPYLNSLVPICTVDSPTTWGWLYQQSKVTVVGIVLYCWSYCRFCWYSLLRISQYGQYSEQYFSIVLATPVLSVLLAQHCRERGSVNKLQCDSRL